MTEEDIDYAKIAEEHSGPGKYAATLNKSLKFYGKWQPKPLIAKANSSAANCTMLLCTIAQWLSSSSCTGKTWAFRPIHHSG